MIPQAFFVNGGMIPDVVAGGDGEFGALECAQVVAQSLKENAEMGGIRDHAMPMFQDEAEMPKRISHHKPSKIADKAVPTSSWITKSNRSSSGVSSRLMRMDKLPEKNRGRALIG